MGLYPILHTVSPPYYNLFYESIKKCKWKNGACAVLPEPDRKKAADKQCGDTFRDIRDGQFKDTKLSNTNSALPLIYCFQK